MRLSNRLRGESAARVELPMRTLMDRRGTLLPGAREAAGRVLDTSINPKVRAKGQMADRPRSRAHQPSEER